jgi:tRNA pseudouridine55 synthase
MNGVIIVDKPAGWTSHDVVNRMRRILQQRSVGHLGTLDPLATGVLPLVTGSLTRLAQFYIASEKTYEGVIRFGFATNTYDADGEPLNDSEPNEVAPAQPNSETTTLNRPPSVPDLHLETLQKLAAEFRGAIQQTPPPFSAKKIQGVPAYKLARKQKEVVLQPVKVEVKEFAITSVENDFAHFRARVSSGTYMRSIAHEMGQRLGCGAHLASLRRTAVAEFDITQAHTFAEIEAVWGGHSCPPTSARSSNPRSSNTSPGNTSSSNQPSRNSVQTQLSAELETLFLHTRQLLPQFPSVTADESTAARIRSGRPINLPDLSRARQVKVFASQTELLAIATRVAGTLFHPRIVFCGTDTPVRRL